MKMEVRERGGIVIVSPEGDIKVGEGDIALREAVQQQIVSGKNQVVLDLAKVRFMDSAGLGELVASLKRVREAGGQLKVAAVNQRITDALTITLLIRVLDIYDDVDGALASFLGKA